MDVMVDIETRGLANDARVIQIGGVAFQLDRVEDAIAILDDRSRWIDATVSPYDNCSEDSDTIAWWESEETAHASRLIASRHPQNIHGALLRLQGFCDTHLMESSYVWARGTDFDIAILRGLYRREGLRLPWAYNQSRDSRTVLTLLSMMGSHYRVPDMSKIGLTRHYAPHDAAVEAVTVQAAIAGMKLSVLQSRFTEQENAEPGRTRLPAEQDTDA